MSSALRKGAQYVCSRAQRGLFAGKTVRHGNNVSEDGGNRTRRNWKPNAQRKRVFSELLGRMLPLSLTTHTLRCIDKAGGLDAYVLNAPLHELGTGQGLQLRLELQLATRLREMQAEMPPSAFADAARADTPPAAAAAAS